MVQNRLNNLIIPLQQKASVKSGKKISQSVLEKKTFKDYKIVYMNIAKEQGQITPWDKML